MKSAFYPILGAVGFAGYAAYKEFVSTWGEVLGGSASLAIVAGITCAFLMPLSSGNFQTFNITQDRPSQLKPEFSLEGQTENVQINSHSSADSVLSQK